jgi:bifunctional oligoribonuclease and PAP phosphatase NrnA
MWRDIKKIIQNHHNFLLTTHVNPDGDGIGAACALTELLFQMGKNVHFVCDSPIPRKFAFLDYHSTHEVYDPNSDFSEIQVVIVLDTHKKARIGRVSQILEQPGVIAICIDHHEVTESFTPYLAVDLKACSVGAMVYTLYKESGFDLNLQAATGIYASVICDTGRFSYSSTSRKAHKIADECMKLGVDPDLMYSRLFQHVSLAEIKVFARALQGMETYLDNKVIIQQIRREDYENMSAGVLDIEHIDLEYIHDFNNLIEDVQCFVLLRELADDHVRVSMRSKTDLDISLVMKALGGGGHPHAAGVSWKGSLEEVKNRILDLLQDLFEQQKKSQNSQQSSQNTTFGERACGT